MPPNKLNLVNDLEKKAQVAIEMMSAKKNFAETTAV